MTLEEVKLIGQPDEILARRSAEHWISHLYARRVSPYLTLGAFEVGMTPNGLTLSMVAVGLIAAYVLSLGGLASSIVAVGLSQLYLILDCSDGELARVTGTASAAGAYLDRLGHYVVDAAVFVAIGVRVDIDDHLWLIVGLVAALLVIIGKAAGDLVHMARAASKLPPLVDGMPVDRPALAHWRRLAMRLPIHRSLGAIESMILIALATSVEVAIDVEMAVQRGLLVALAVIAGGVAVGRAVSTVSSSRLR